MLRIKTNVGIALASLAAILASHGALAQSSSAAPKPNAPAVHARAPCFFVSQWQGWKAPNDHTLYLAVDFHQVYQVDLAGRSALLQDPDARLVNLTQVPDTVCTPLDLQLSVATFAGMREPLIATHLSKLTPEQVAAIPKKYLPY
jgi:hypothetical protein